MRKLILLALLCVAPAYAAPRADLKLHALFSDHMVLQADLAAPVWGTAEPGDEVTVAIAGQKKSAKAAADGRWIVKLDPLKTGGPHEMSVGGKITLKDVLVGEVWVCSGQSNMEMSVKSSANSAVEIGAADFPKIRLFTVPKKPAMTPQADVVGSWKVCTPESVPGFSAVAYFFGRDLQKAMDVPVGLIHTSWGGDRKSTRLNSSHIQKSRMPSSA